MKNTKKPLKAHLSCLDFVSGRKKAFSLIEILVSLIIISLVVSAFVPVVTKKLKSTELTVGGFGTAITSDHCDQYSVDTHKCIMCTTSSCSLCTSQLNVSTGYYVDPSLSCEPKRCSDKFGSSCVACNKDNCTSCPNVTAGYYADPNENCVQRKCSDKFGAGCATCSKESCTSCNSGYGYNSLTNTCTQCSGGYASPGGASGCTKCDAGAVATAGSSSCTVCVAANHKVPNAAGTACVDKYCGQGQYIENVTCKSCTGGTYQDSTSHQSSTCKTCNASSHLVANATTGATGCTSKYCGANQYLDGVTCKTCSAGTYQTSTSHQNTSCSSCPTGCSACTSATKCTACAADYTLNSSNMCIQGCNPQTVTLSGTTTQVTRFNMGDDPQCPRETIKALTGVTFVPAGTECTDNYCCWYGDTAKTCTDTSGGIYSGCSRTVCKWWAADKICKSIGEGWALPATYTSMSTWYPANSKAASGLMFCANDGSNSNYSKCIDATTCIGAKSNICGVHYVWAYTGTDTATQYRGLNEAKWKTGTMPKTSAYSVRCVKQ